MKNYNSRTIKYYKDSNGEFINIICVECVPMSKEGLKHWTPNFRKKVHKTVYKTITPTMKLYDCICDLKSLHQFLASAITFTKQGRRIKIFRYGKLKGNKYFKKRIQIFDGTFYPDRVKIYNKRGLTKLHWWVR